jgi:hypothetical protein
VPKVYFEYHNNVDVTPNPVFRKRTLGKRILAFSNAASLNDAVGVSADLATASAALPSSYRVILV